MTTPAPTGYVHLKKKQAQLIRKALEGSVFIAPTSAAVVTAASLFDATSGDLLTPIVAGYEDLGWTTAAGVKISRSLKLKDTTSWGSTNPTRTDPTSDVTTVVVEAQETKLLTIGLYTGADLASLTPGTNGVVEVQQPPLPPTRYYRVLTLAIDEGTTGEFVIAHFMPRAAVTDITDQTLSDGDTPVTYGVTFTAYTTDSAGYPVNRMWGGAGFKALKTTEGTT